MHKIKQIVTVVIIALLLSVLLVLQADADTTDAFDKRVTNKLKTGGVVKTQIFAQWELWKYKETVLPKKYPFKYAPWESYVAIDRNVIVGGDSKHYSLTISENLYSDIEPIAKKTRANAKKILKQYGVKGTGKKAYFKIRKYVRSGDIIVGIKSANGFFENHGGDCAAHAAAVYVLCKVQGIPVRYCIGSWLGYLHAWNKVKLGGKWYWTDEMIEIPLERKLEPGYYGVMVMW